MKHLYVVTKKSEFASVNFPDLRESFNVIVADEFFALVEANLDDLTRELGGAFRVMPPKAGKFIDSSGDEVYVDDNATIVASAAEVIESLGLEAEGDPDDQLQQLDRVF